MAAAPTSTNMVAAPFAESASAISVADGWSNASPLAPEKHSLAMILRDHGPVPPQVAVDIALDVCDALASAHANGVVHGDLGLHRVRTVWPRRSSDGVDIFALAADDTAAFAFRANRAGSLVAPEQRAGRAIDARADVWAVGMLLHWMLTGQAPATDGSVRLQMLPRSLAQTIEACIAPNPAHRPSSVDEISATLGSFASCPTERFEQLAVRRGIKTGARAVVRAPDVDSVLGRLEAAADERERLGSVHVAAATAPSPRERLGSAHLAAATPTPTPPSPRERLGSTHLAAATAPSPATPATAPPLHAAIPAAPPVPAPPKPRSRTAWTGFRPIIRKRAPSAPDARDARDLVRPAPTAARVAPVAHGRTEDHGIETLRAPLRYPDAPVNDAPCSIEPVTPLRIVDRPTLEPTTERMEPRHVASFDAPTTVFASADSSEEPTIAPSVAHLQAAEHPAPPTTRDEAPLYGLGGESPTVAAASMRASDLATAAIYAPVNAGPMNGGAFNDGPMYAHAHGHAGHGEPMRGPGPAAPIHGGSMPMHGAGHPGPTFGDSIHASPAHAHGLAGPTNDAPTHAAPTHAPERAVAMHAYGHASPAHATPMVDGSARDALAHAAHASPMHAPIHAPTMHASPTHASPMHATPMHATPMHASPMHASPMHASPMHASPVHASPMHASPMHASPMHASPMHASPVHASTMHASPMHAPTRANAPAAGSSAPRLVASPPTAFAGAAPVETATVHLPPREGMYAQQSTERMHQPASIAPVVLAIPAYPSPLPPSYAGYMAPLPPLPPPSLASLGLPAPLGAQLFARAERSPRKTFATVCFAAAALAFGLSLWSRLGASEAVHVAAPTPIVAAPAPAPAPVPPPPAVTTTSPSALPNAGASPSPSPTPVTAAPSARPGPASTTAAPAPKPRASRPAPRRGATANPSANATASTPAPAPAGTDDVPASREE